MWGKLEQLKDDSADTRNIPTHVGKTPFRVYVNVPFGKHPHTHGENSEPEGIAKITKETSPHTWGKPPVISGIGRLRNIPTHVGKTH